MTAQEYVRVKASELSSIIGVDDFAVLLAMLPDTFFDLSDADQSRIWSKMVSRCNRGKWTLHELAHVAVEVQS